jgi:hypothetical protein
MSRAPKAKPPCKGSFPYVPNLGNLIVAVRALDPSAVVSSCANTVRILSDRIGNNPLDALQQVSSMLQDDVVRKISDLLDGPNMVCITTSPDHHFIVFPIDVGELMILQGFQGVYNLMLWYQNKGRRSVPKFQFIENLYNLVSPNQARRLRGAASLFSYRTPTQNVKAAIDNYFQIAATIKFVTHKIL